MVAHFPSKVEAMASLSESGVTANSEFSLLIDLGIKRRVETCFFWLLKIGGGKWGCIDEKACELMLWILGNHRFQARFYIDELQNSFLIPSYYYFRLSK